MGNGGHDWAQVSAEEFNDSKETGVKIVRYMCGDCLAETWVVRPAGNSEGIATIFIPGERDEPKE